MVPTALLAAPLQAALAVRHAALLCQAAAQHVIMQQARSCEQWSVTCSETGANPLMHPSSTRSLQWQHEQLQACPEPVQMHWQARQQLRMSCTQNTAQPHMAALRTKCTPSAPWCTHRAHVTAAVGRSMHSSAITAFAPSQPSQQQQQPRLQAPKDLKAASMQEMAQLLPFSYEICSYRHRSFESRRMGVLYKPQADDETGGASAAVVQARSPSDSYLEMHYPFSSNPLLRDQYERFESGHIRLGLILEDLDTFAGDVAARHAGPPGPPRGYVTGSVDSISWFNSTGGCSSSGGSSISSGGGSNNTNSSCSSSNSSSSSSSSITWSSAHAARRPGGALALDEDLKVAGQVVWVGSSSMEVQIELSALSKASKQWMYVGMARFIMVARDVAAGVSVAVPALTADSEQERLMQALGLERQAERKALREQPGGPLQLATPTQAEVAMLYDLLARHTGNKTEQQKEQQRQEGGMLADGAQQPQQQQDQEEEEGLVRKPRAVPLSHTRLLTASLMHRQDRNTSFRIFGGHLLREAFEAAFVAAALHAGSADVEALSMADVSFQHPVPIGAILQFEAQVVYTDGPLMRIAVRALKRDPGDPTSRLITNDFSFAFVNNSRRPVVPVYPESLDEAAAYLVGYRRHIEEGFAAPEAPNHAPARVINSRA